MKAHPALFEGEGKRGEPKNEALLFQSTVDIHFQNEHKTLFQSTVDIHFQNAHKTQKTAKTHKDSLALCAFILYSDSVGNTHNIWICLLLRSLINQVLLRLTAFIHFQGYYFFLWILNNRLPLTVFNPEFLLKYVLMKNIFLNVINSNKLNSQQFFYINPTTLEPSPLLKRKFLFRTLCVLSRGSSGLELFRFLVIILIIVLA